MKTPLNFRLGISTAVTLLLALSIAGYFWYQHQHATSHPPIIERQVLGDTPHAIAPVPEYLLRHQQELKLSPTQVREITVIAHAYRIDIAPIKERLNVAAKDFSTYTERHHGDSRLHTQQFDSHGAEVQRLSRVVFTTRYAYWQQACAVLNTTQQQQAVTLARQATLNDLQ